MTHDDALADSVEQFAADLRALRLEAESPTLSRLQHDAGISKTVLSEAFAGRRLPSVRTVDRIVRALGVDSAEWVLRRDALAAARTAASSAEEFTGEGPRAGSAAPAEVTPVHSVRGISRRAAALTAIAAFAAGAVLATGANWAVNARTMSQAHAQGSAHQATDAPVQPRAQITVADGVDPALTPCIEDAKVVASSPRGNGTRLEIIFSNKCYAGWARVNRYDHAESGNAITVAIYPEPAAQGPSRQTATEPDVQSAYTTLLVRPTPQTRLCAVGAVTVDGESIDLGEPLCT